MFFSLDQKGGSEPPGPTTGGGVRLFVAFGWLALLLNISVSLRFCSWWAHATLCQLSFHSQEAPRLQAQYQRSPAGRARDTLAVRQASARVPRRVTLPHQARARLELRYVLGREGESVPAGFRHVAETRDTLCRRGNDERDPVVSGKSAGEPTSGWSVEHQLIYYKCGNIDGIQRTCDIGDSGRI